MTWLPNSTFNVIVIKKTNIIFKLKTWKILCYYIFYINISFNYQLLLIESCCRHTYSLKLFVYKENNLCLLLQLQLNFLFAFFGTLSVSIPTSVSIILPYLLLIKSSYLWCRNDIHHRSMKYDIYGNDKPDI